MLRESRSSLGPVVALLLLVIAAPAAAQIRYVEGYVQGRWQEYDPFNPKLTTTVTTTGGRQCNDPAVNPAKYCVGQNYPFLAACDPPNVVSGCVLPVGSGPGPRWARLSAGTATGDPVQMPFASEWGLTTMGTIPSGVIPNVVSIMTWFEGRNDMALTATGKGWSAGGGPGNLVVNPAASVIPSATYLTRTFPSATPGSFGNTGVPGNTITATFPSLQAQPNSALRMQFTAGPRQFGGSVQILIDTPNQLTLSTPGGNNYVRTNGRCPVGSTPGHCHSGFDVGSGSGNYVDLTTARIYKATAAPITLFEHWRWYAAPWTTGTVSVAGNFGNAQTSFGRTGTDIGGSARNLVMVTPILAYGQPLPPQPVGSTAQIWKWNVTFVPEPAEPLGIASAVGVLGVLFLVRRRRQRA